MQITKHDLKNLAYKLNELTNSPIDRYTNNGLNRNVGHYYISNAYGGYQLHRYVNDGGAYIEMSKGGYISKRELYNQMFMMIKGLEFREYN